MVFLVSNWHVIAGRSVNDGTPMHPSGATPVSMEIELPPSLAQQSFSIDLVNGDDVNLWSEHPTLGRRVDLAAVLLGSDDELTRMALPLQHEVKLDRIDVFTDVSIVGYPTGRSGGERLPIWTRGSVASEPDVDLEDLPRVLVDARTREGQSGSPVVIYSRTVHYARLSETEDEQPNTAIFGKPVTIPLGIYSGRFADLELGYVWKWSAVVELVEHCLDRFFEGAPIPG